MTRRLAWRIVTVAAFASMAAFILLTCYGNPYIGLAFGVAMLGCIVAAAGLDPESRWQRRRYYRKQRAEQLHPHNIETRVERRRILLHTINPRQPDAERIPPCPACRVIVYPNRTTERVPCGWHADIKSVALERELTQ